VRSLGRVLGVVLLLVGLVAALVVVDHLVRRRVEQRISETVAAQFGGEVTTELGGWPFLASQLTGRVEDARITIDRVTVPVQDRFATIEHIDLTAVGLAPIDDFDQTRAERLDARALMTWGELSTLLGFPISHVEGDRISARTSIEALGVVAVAELQADLGVQPDGRLVLSNATASAAGARLPQQVVQPAVELLAPTMQLPQFEGLSYQGLELDSSGIAALLNGADVQLSAIA